MQKRTGRVVRKTKETEISIGLGLDGEGKTTIDTGIPFFDHMLELFGRHGLFDLEVRARGDLEVDFHHKLTMPFICIIATIIGIPVGAHTGRKGALAGIMLAIGMFFGFYALQFTMEYLAKQMILEPWAGAWTAIAVFAGIGGAMIHRMR